MLIEDLQGKYTINFDEKRRIVYEKNVGAWTKDEVLRWHNDYVSKLGSLLVKKPWAKCCDLREYRTSSIVDEVKIHDEWIQKNNFACGCMIVESAIVKMQMKRAVAGNPNAEIVLTEKEADEWLRSKGF